jgi:uncharacterized protein involved in outer membrane biogenesis
MMNKSLKIALVVATIFLVLFGVGVWYVSAAINPAQLTKILSSTVKSSTGRDLTIAGPVSLNFFPSIGVSADQVSLSNADWATDKQMFTLKHIEMNIKLMPLLKGDIEISGIKIVGLDSHLQTNKAGDGNWVMTGFVDMISQPTVGATNNTNSANNTSKASADNSISSSNPFVAIETLDITDARITYQDDKSAATEILFPKFVLDRNGSKTDVLVEARYANYKLGVKGKMDVLRDAVINWDQKPVKMAIDLVATINDKAMAITGVINKAPQTLPQFDIALNSKSFSLLPLAGSAAAVAVSGSANKGSVKQEQSKYFFSDEPLPFTMLPEADGKISLNIAELLIPHQAPFINLKADAIFNKQHIEVNDFSFSLGKGSAQGQIVIDQYHSANPSVKMKGMAQGFTWQQMIGSSDASSKVSGGEVQIAMNIQGSGKSLHQIVSRANGAMQLSVGPATMGTQYLNEGGDLVISILDAINPMQKKTSQTILTCAVAYLPISNGVINVNNSIGIETDRLNIVGNGSVNLATEVLNLSIDPKEKSGLTTGIDLGGLVKLQGTLQNPKAGVNQAGVVNSAVSIGLGFLTGGISIAAENAKGMLSKTQPCKTALHSWSNIYPGESK